MRVPDGDRIVSIAKVLDDDEEETTVDETVGSTEVSTDSVERILKSLNRFHLIPVQKCSNLLK